GVSPEEATESDRHARAALAPYHALEDPRWRERPLVRHLPQQKREELEGTVASLLLILARGEAVHASAALLGDERERRLGVAWEPHAQAARNGAAQHLPRALLAQKAAFFGLQRAKDQERACRAEAEKQLPRGAPDACATGRELMIQARHEEALTFLLDATRQ